MNKNDEEIEKALLGFGAALGFLTFLLPAIYVTIVYNSRERYLWVRVTDQLRVGMPALGIGGIAALGARALPHISFLHLPPITKIGHLTITYTHLLGWTSVNVLLFAALYLTAPFWVHLLKSSSKAQGVSSEFRL